MRAPTLFSYLSPEEATAICKLAEPEKPPRLALGLAKAVGVPLLGLAAGTAGGFAAGQVADAISKKLVGHPIPRRYAQAAIPALGASLGLAYSMYKAHEMEEMRRAVESHKNRSSS